MKITLEIKTSAGGTDLGYVKTGEPKNDQEQIVLEAVLHALNQTIQFLSDNSEGCKFVSREAIPKTLN